MSLLRISELGEPILRTRATLVDESQILTSRFQTMLDDMVTTLHDSEGVGLAAPQIYESSRIVVIDVTGVTDTDRYPDAETNPLPLLVVINPELQVLTSETEEDWEACLSIPGLRGLVPRFSAVHLSGLDRSGARVHVDLHSFPARVAQHEVDHLDGIVYLDRMTSLASLCFDREYRRYHATKASGEPDLVAQAAGE